MGGSRSFPSRFASARMLGIVVAILAAIVVLIVVNGSGGDEAARSGDVAGPAAEATAPPAASPETPSPEPVSEPTAGPPDASVGTAAWARQLLDKLTISDASAPDDEPYERDDYDGWFDADGDCQTSRHEVLIAESTASVEFTDSTECKVAAGSWTDPYTGEVVTSAEQASIDHVVSLSQAHHAGAWAWTSAWKQALFNDIDDPATLAVSLVTVNQAKGSLGPQDWLPDALDARCLYVIARVRVHARWQLTITTAEHAALEAELAVCDELGLPASPVTAPLVIIDFDEPPPGPGPRPTPRITPGTCDPAYTSVCIPMSDDNLDCEDIDPRNFAITGDDRHFFDGNNDGIACEDP